MSPDPRFVEGQMQLVGPREQVLAQLMPATIPD